MNMTERKLRNARAQVVQAHPFFGALLLKQEIVETTDVETMATNGKQLFYNPTFIESIEPDELHFVIAHEALHPGLLHHTRRNGRDHGLWNQACDYAINPILVDARVGKMPEGGLLRHDLRDMSAEAIYVKLQNEMPPPPPPSQDDESDDDDEQDDDGDESGQGAGAGDEQDDEDDDDTRQDASEGASGDGSDDTSHGGDDRSADGGSDAPTQTPSYGGCGAVIDAPAKDDVDMKSEESDWRVALGQAAMAAGTLPGSLQRLIDEVLEPEADWREMLSRFMSQFSRDDYSWRVPNRRFVANGLYLPSVHSEQLPPIAFVVDASGSMPREALMQVLGETQSFMSSLPFERLDVIVHDTGIRSVQSFDAHDDVTSLDAKAGGGTLFKPVVDWIEQGGEDYACIVWFTDLCPADFDSTPEPEAPVIWINYGDFERAAPFGEVVNMEISR